MNRWALRTHSLHRIIFKPCIYPLCGICFLVTPSLAVSDEATISYAKTNSQLDTAEAQPPVSTDKRTGSQTSTHERQNRPQTHHAPRSHLIEMRSPLIFYLGYFALHEKGASD